mgnify:CR=1 FL=1
MNRKLLLLCLSLFALKGYSQDSIVNYLSRKGKVVSKEKARFTEVIKKNDSVWQAKTFYNNGKLFRIGNFKKVSKRKPIGNFFSFHRNGKLKSVLFYDNKNKKHGKTKTFFYNGTKSSDGIYVKGFKEGAWNFYHFNGEIATRIFYKKNKIIKSIVYDKPGIVSSKPLIKYQKPEYYGGKDKFREEVKKMTDFLTFKVEGKIYVNFIIDIYGRIRNVEIDEIIPQKLKSQIIKYFENIEGWSPCISMSRFYPYNFEIPLKF